MAIPLVAPPYMDDLAVLLPMIGAQGGTEFPSFTRVPRSVARAGNAQTVTAQSKFYGSSGYFDGNGDYLSLGAGLPATGDFTLAAWLRVPNAARAHRIFASSGGGTHRCQFYINDGDIRFWRASTGQVTSTGGPHYEAGEWFHVAWVRYGSTLRGYINGTEVLSTPGDTFDTDALQVGVYRAETTVDAFLGYAQDIVFALRALWTTDFTPPRQMVAPTDWGWMPVDAISQLIQLDGKVTINTLDGPPAERVLIIDPDSSLICATVTPETSGIWTASVPPGDYYIGYLNPGCQPILHGPYHVEAD